MTKNDAIYTSYKYIKIMNHKMSLCINEILFLLYIFIKYVLVATDHDLDFQQQIDVEVTDSPRLSSLLTQSTEELLLWEHELNFQKQI